VIIALAHSKQLPFRTSGMAGGKAMTRSAARRLSQMLETLDHHPIMSVHKASMELQAAGPAKSVGSIHSLPPFRSASMEQTNSPPMKMSMEAPINGSPKTPVSRRGQRRSSVEVFASAMVSLTPFQDGEDVGRIDTHAQLGRSSRDSLLQESAIMAGVCGLCLQQSRCLFYANSIHPAGCSRFECCGFYRSPTKSERSECSKQGTPYSRMRRPGFIFGLT
jgi:hypothetical protein